MSTEKKWYVIYTKPRWEKKVAGLLDNKAIEFYCPLNKVNRKWSDRIKVVHEPLFKGYIFVKLTEHTKWDIKMVDGVINFIYWLGKPAVVKQIDIDNIKKFLNEFEDVKVVDTSLQPNDEVQVKQGALMNYKGIILEIKGNTAKIKIDSMGISLIATIENSNLSKSIS